MKRFLHKHAHPPTLYCGVRSREGEAGFTLIEMLVALAVLVIILAASIEGFIRYAQRQAYLSTVNDVHIHLKQIREDTLASYDDTLYGVYVGTSSIEFFEGASPVVGNPTNTIFTYDDLLITATSSLSNGNWYLTFARLTGEASATGTITVFDVRSSASNTFTVYTSGLIE